MQPCDLHQHSYSPILNKTANVIQTQIKITFGFYSSWKWHSALTTVGWWKWHSVLTTVGWWKRHSVLITVGWWKWHSVRWLPSAGESDTVCADYRWWWKWQCADYRWLVKVTVCADYRWLMKAETGMQAVMVWRLPYNLHTDAWIPPATAEE